MQQGDQQLPRGLREVLARMQTAGVGLWKLLHRLGLYLSHLTKKFERKVKAKAVSKASFFLRILFFWAFFCACHVCQSAMADVGWSAPILSVSFPESRAVTEVTHSGPQLKMLWAPVGK